MSAPAAAIKRILPQPVKSALKSALNVADPLFVRMFRKRTGYAAPIPPRILRGRVGSADVARFVDAGNACAAALHEGLHRAGRAMNDFRSILDFGCGCGRTMQSFYDSKLDRFHGCDVDRSAIEWMQRNYRSGSFAVNQFDPPLPYSAAQFDLVYCISIFTHLNEEKQVLWLDEIGRVLQPLGIALISVQGEHARTIFQSGVMGISRSCLDRVRNRPPLDNAAFVFEPYEELKQRSEDFPGIEDTYGLTFHSPAYIRSKWQRSFTVVDIIPGIVDSLQDLVVLRKNG